MCLALLPSNRLGCRALKSARMKSCSLSKPWQASIDFIGPYLYIDSLSLFALQLSQSTTQLYVMEGSNLPVPEAPVTNGAASMSNGALNVSAVDFAQVPLQDQYNIQSFEAQPQAQPISAG